MGFQLSSDVDYRANVLDHGFVQLRNLAGPTRRPHQEFDAHDVDPPNAARMSFEQMDTGRTEDEDHRLSRYLMKNWHTSPFEMIEAWIEMKLPILVARQFVRHRTVSLNEVSARYVTLPAEWYIPRLEDIKFQVGDKKQGGRLIDMTSPEEVEKGMNFQANLDRQCASSYALYLSSIQDGIANEQARTFLHVNHYTHWLWKQDFHNILNFLSLRDHSHAQGEATYYARAIDGLLRAQLPKSMMLYDEYRRRP